jgi:hypothetical protein
MKTNIERIKGYIIEKCEAQLNYYDIVDENSETVDYEAIADFVIGLFVKNK